MSNIYKFQRSSLQFDKKFIQWLDEVRGNEAKNKYIERMCGYVKENKENDKND